MFTDGFTSLAQVLFTIWNFFTAFDIPGTSFSPAEWLLGLFVIAVAIKILRSLTGGSGGESYRGADSSRNVKISESRKHDQF